MELIIIISIFISLLIKPSDTLSCGLFAWNGRYPSSFKIQNFKILGLFNDTRGGDSCGIFANGLVTKGLNGDSKFKDFWKSYDFSKTKGAKLVIGHARKASVGHISHDSAQPIAFSFKTSSKTVKKGIVVAHNGTLTNYEKLAEKYKIDTKELSSDSQVLAYLLYFHGWKILQEYEGSAALIIHLLQEPDTFYVFKGASKIYAASTVLAEERPLYYYQESKNSIYFSSMEDSLTLLLDDPTTNTKEESKIKELPENIIFKVKNGVISVVQNIDRTTVVKKFESSVNEYYNRGKSASLNSHHNVNVRDYMYDEGANYSACCEGSVITNGRKLDPEKEILDTSMFNASNLLYYCRFRYYLNTKLADGSYFVNQYGRVYENWLEAISNNKVVDIRKLFFIRGILLKDLKSYQEVLKITSSVTKTSDFESFNTICKLIPFSIYPMNLKNAYQSYLYKNIPGGKNNFYSGSFQPMFHNKIYTVDEGELLSISTETSNFKGEKYPNYYYPAFNSSLEVFVDQASAHMEVDMSDLGTHVLGFNDDEHQKIIEKNCKKGKTTVPTDVIVITANTDKPKDGESDAYDEILRSQIEEIKDKLKDSISKYQGDLSEIDFRSNAPACSLYNKLENFLTEINNDDFLPF